MEADFVTASYLRLHINLWEFESLKIHANTLAVSGRINNATFQQNFSVNENVEFISPQVTMLPLQPTTSNSEIVKSFIIGRFRELKCFAWCSLSFLNQSHIFADIHNVPSGYK